MSSLIIVWAVLASLLSYHLWISRSATRKDYEKISGEHEFLKNTIFHLSTRQVVMTDEQFSRFVCAVEQVRDATIKEPS